MVYNCIDVFLYCFGDMSNRTKIKEQFDLEGICMHVSSKGDGLCFCCALHLDIDIISTGIFMESS